MSDRSSPPLKTRKNNMLDENMGVLVSPGKLYPIGTKLIMHRLSQVALFKELFPDDLIETQYTMPNKNWYRGFAVDGVRAWLFPMQH